MSSQEIGDLLSRARLATVRLPVVSSSVGPRPDTDKSAVFGHGFCRLTLVISVEGDGLADVRRIREGHRCSIAHFVGGGNHQALRDGSVTLRPNWLGVIPLSAIRSNSCLQFVWWQP